MEHARHWIAVASADHARRGRDHQPPGFMQVSRGKPRRCGVCGRRIA